MSIGDIILCYIFITSILGGGLGLSISQNCLQVNEATWKKLARTLSFTLFGLVFGHLIVPVGILESIFIKFRNNKK